MPADDTATPSADDLILSLIKRTGMPIAPIVIQKLSDALDIVKRSKMFIKESKQEQAEAIQGRMLKDFPSEELNGLAGKPEFVAALCILLEVSIKYYAIETARQFPPGTPFNTK